MKYNKQFLGSATFNNSNDKFLYVFMNGILYTSHYTKTKHFNYRFIKSLRVKVKALKLLERFYDFRIEKFLKRH